MEYRLGELIESISETSKIEKDKVVLINTSDVENGKVLNHTYVDNKNLRGQFKKRFKEGDILYSEIRPKNKRFAYIDFDSTNYIASTKLMVLRNKGKINNKYLFLLLTSKKIIEYLQMIAESRSGTFPQITFEELSNVIVNVPNLKSQNKIVNIIDVIDKKIELNNQINNNLQEISRQLYKRWFIDFEFPNANGKPYKTNGGKMVDSEFGEIPENWNVKTLDDLNLDISDGNYSSKYPTKSEFVDNGIPFIRGTDFIGTTISRTGLMFISEKKHNELKKGHLKKNDILITTRGEIGKIAYVPKKYIDANINAQLIRINGKTEFSKSFLGNFLLSFKTQQEINSLITGSALQQLPVGKFKQIKIVLPQDRNIIQKYNELTECYYEKIEELEDENEILTKLRDTLLPKLMNGEIDLDNIEI